jgi:hypothetical protein
VVDNDADLQYGVDESYTLVVSDGGIKINSQTVYHDTTMGVQRGILDLDGLFNDQIALPIRDDNLPCPSSMFSTGTWTILSRGPCR